MESTYDMTDTVLFAVAFGLYDVDNSGLIDESEFKELATNMLVGQANGVRSHITLLAVLHFVSHPSGSNTSRKAVDGTMLCMKSFRRCGRAIPLV